VCLTNINQTILDPSVYLCSMAAATTKSHFHGHHAETAPAPRKSTRPRLITETERAAIEPLLEKVHYSPRYPSSSKH
jgi:hypothetical protein